MSGQNGISLGGIPTLIEGSLNDPYFQSVAAQALALSDLAQLIDRQSLAGKTVIDVGANIGLSTILLARSAGQVIAFEPSPPNVDFLRRNLLLNGITNVTVIPSAASSYAGFLRFHVAQFGAGSHIVASGHVAGGAISTISVEAIALDQLNLSPIAFIKIDAEGHEPDVLAGARQLLARDRPLIYTEINVWCLSAFAGHSPGAFVRKVWEAFEVGRPQPNGHVVPLENGYSFLHDLIAKSAGIGDLVLRPRSGKVMPTLRELTWPQAAVDALRVAEA